MPNTDAPFGFAPNISLAGGTPSRTSGYRVAADYATAIFSGDLVRSVGTDRNVEVVAAGGSSRVLGVFAGCQYVNDTGDVVWAQYWPGVALADTTKIVECYVYDDPALELTAQITTAAAADVGGVFDIVDNGGNPVTGRSGQEVNEALVTNPKVRVNGLAENIGGIFPSEYGAFAKVRLQYIEPERATLGTVTAV